MRAWVWVTCGCFVVFVSGCGAGAVLGGLGIDSLNDDDDNVVTSDLPPTVTAFAATPDGSRDRIRVEFSISNDDAGTLSARVDFLEVGQPLTAARAMTLLAGSDPLEQISAGTNVVIFWNAKDDLDDRFATVEFVVTPFEDGKTGLQLRWCVPHPGAVGRRAQSKLY